MSTQTASGTAGSSGDPGTSLSTWTLAGPHAQAEQASARQSVADQGDVLVGRVATQRRDQAPTDRPETPARRPRRSTTML